MEGFSLKDWLDYFHDRYNRPDFIYRDPISIPHLFESKEDREIAGFLTSLISWGRRDLILRAAHDWMERLEMEPYRFITEGTIQDWKRMASFQYRTFFPEDALGIMKGLRDLYQGGAGLESLMALSPESSNTLEGIVRLRSFFLGLPGFPPRTVKHLADPTAGSSAKRLNMFLRWMVRSDRRGVDFGVWTSVRPDQLVCPLDVHTGTVARELGLLARNQNDWKSAISLTNRLKEFDPQDPIKYDLALFGFGEERKNGNNDVKTSEFFHLE